MERQPISPDGSCDPRLDTAQPTRLELLVHLMDDVGFHSTVGPAWLLYLRLVLIEKGVVIGTYEDIGRPMGVPASTARSWVKMLEKSGVITFEQKGRRIEVKLLGAHVEAALAPEHVLCTHEGTDGNRVDGPRMKALSKLLEASEEAGGAELEVRMVV